MILLVQIINLIHNILYFRIIINGEYSDRALQANNKSTGVGQHQPENVLPL